jgi:hypothetical protein
VLAAICTDAAVAGDNGASRRAPYSASINALTVGLSAARVF